METLLLEVENRIGCLTLNRPEKRNALSPTLVEELKQGLATLQNDDSVKVIVLKANGKVFCAGADLGYLQELQTNTYQENLEDSLRLKELFQAIYNCPKPIIAQVHGHAIAGGCGLANVCDFVFSVPEAKYGYTEVRIGFVPAIVMFFLLRKIGEGRAKELLLSGDLISAQTAYEYGLINFLVEKDELEEKVKAFGADLANKNSGQSMALVKEMTNQIQLMGLEEGLTYASEKNAEARGTEDCQRGIAAFLNKEAISF